MNLTLRTLLAYLDDTLDPQQTRDLGKQVAESEAAAELIAKINKVTRKRNLPVPGLEAKGLGNDPNTIAEYLENALEPEQVRAMEELLLESDQHLAEVAACHQVLTLIDGEPAQVPMTARQRMYGLVQGREANPSARPPIPPSSGFDRDDLLIARLEDEPSPYWGLPGDPETPWFQRPIILALLLGAVGLLIAAFQVGVPEPPKPSLKAAPFAPPKAATEAVGKAKEIVRPVERQPVPVVKVDPPPMKVEPPPMKVEPPPMKVEPKKEELVRVIPDPSERVVPIGRLVGDKPLVIARSPGKDTWARLLPGLNVEGRTTVAALPGSEATINLDERLWVSLWSSFPTLETPSFTTRLRFFAPEAPFLADVLLESGRIFITSRSAESLRMVLRFRTERWDILLASKTELVVQLRNVGRPGARLNDAPTYTETVIGVLSGNATIRVGGEPMDAKSGTLVRWNSETGRLVSEASTPEQMQMLSKRTITERNDFREAAKVIDERLKDNAIPNLVFVALRKESTASPPITRAIRLQTIAGLGVIDDIRSLFELAGDDSQGEEFRQAAISELVQWMHGQDEGPAILQKQLVEFFRFEPNDAASFVQLLLPLSPEGERDINNLKSLLRFLLNPRLAVREAALGQLQRIDKDGPRETRYHTLDKEEGRVEAVRRWTRRFETQLVKPAM